MFGIGSGCLLPGPKALASDTDQRIGRLPLRAGQLVDLCANYSVMREASQVGGSGTHTSFAASHKSDSLGKTDLGIRRG